MKVGKSLISVQHYLDLVNKSVLTLHLRNISFDAKTGEFYDNAQQNVDATFQNLRDQLDQCQQELSVTVSEEGSRLICTLLAIFTDEDVLTSGLYPRRILWPKLQVPFIGNKAGGIVFFDLLDEALASSIFNSRVYEVFEALLGHGYKGRYLDDLPKIQRYREVLGSIVQKDIMAEI